MPERYWDIYIIVAYLPKLDGLMNLQYGQTHLVLMPFILWRVVNWHQFWLKIIYYDDTWDIMQDFQECDPIIACYCLWNNRNKLWSKSCSVNCWNYKTVFESVARLRHWEEGRRWWSLADTTWCRDRIVTHRERSEERQEIQVPCPSRERVWSQRPSRDRQGNSRKESLWWRICQWYCLCEFHATLNRLLKCYVLQELLWWYCLFVAFMMRILMFSIVIMQVSFLTIF